MAEPGDPTTPPTPAPDVDHDDLIGFSSADRLQGRPRRTPPPETDPADRPERDLFDAGPAAASPDPWPPRQPASEAPVHVAPVHAEPVQASTVPAWAVETPVDPTPVRARGRAVETPGDVENATGLYAVYALILFAVPTLGVSALIALLAVTGRAGPSHPVAASHFMFQQRTLWIGGGAALLGGILIAVGLGVFVLFIVAVWLILRGTSGILALKAGRPVRDPRGWFLA